MGVGRTAIQRQVGKVKFVDKESLSFLEIAIKRGRMHGGMGGGIEVHINFGTRMTDF